MPEGCSREINNCDYFAEWSMMASVNMLSVTVTAKIKEDEWLGIGFSNNKVMVQKYSRFI